LNDDNRVEFDSSDNTIRWVRKIDRSVDNELLRKEIGRNIRKFIIYRGIQQQELSEKIGITEAMLSRYINGTSMPRLDKLHNIASVLGCRIDDLLGVDE
jgi:DNA-binding Xre family transcriptional regulator